MHVRIGDFGISWIEEPTTTATITRTVSQTMTWWSAPELTEENAVPDNASDVWAFGCACLLVSDCVELATLRRSVDFFLYP